MRSGYLIFFALLTSYTRQDRPRKIRFELSSRGPNVTIHLDWDPPFCEDRLLRRHWVKLCSKPDECSEKEVLRGSTATFDSNGDKPLSFFSTYNVIVVYRCPSRTKWSTRDVDTGAGELRNLRGVEVTRGNQSAIITWPATAQIGDNVEITVCQKSPASCSPTVRTSVSSGNYTVGGLSPGLEYTGKLSVRKVFEERTYRSEAMTVDLIASAIEDRPRKIRYELSSRGPNVTIHLDWDPPFCGERRLRRHWVKLCSKQNECSEKEVLRGSTATFDSNGDKPLSFFSTYNVIVVYRCPSRTKWSTRDVDTGAGELRTLRGVEVAGGNQSALITWPATMQIGDCVEITVCQKSSASCSPTVRTSISSGNYTVEGLSLGVEYTAKLSVRKQFKERTYRSKAVTVDLEASAIEDRPRKIRFELSSRGPNVTIHLDWDPPFCKERLLRRHWVKLCSKQNKCSEKEVLRGKAATFDSSENKPLSFFSTYNVIVVYRCPSRTKWSTRDVDTGAGELRSLHGVEVTGGNQSAIITWPATAQIGDYVEITVCQKSPASCSPTVRTSVSSGNYTVGGLSPGVEYAAKLSVRKVFKERTYRSKAVTVDLEASAIEVPGPPLRVRVTLSRGQKIVQWDGTDSRFNVASYKIVATAIGSREQTVTFRKNPRFEVSVLQPYTRYVLNISACTDVEGNGCGPPTSLEIETTDRGYPSKPRIELAAKNCTHIVVRWWKPEQPAGPIDGYEFAYGRADDAFTASNWVRVDRSERSAAVSSLEADTTYKFHVVAFNLDHERRALYSLAGILEATINGTDCSPN